MTLVTQEQRWRSQDHVGEARPILKAWVRRGHLERHYENKPDDQVFSYIPGLKGPNAVWYATWHPDEDYMEVPNILSATGDGDLSDQNGVEQATFEIDNVVMNERSGVSGIFHSVARGYLAPFRGDRGWQGVKVGAVNEFHDTFKDHAAQIMVCAGYGSAFFPLFCGLIDDCDLSSRPDRITVVARNMGLILTDQHTFLDAKHLWVHDPITFCDRQQADELAAVERNARAKSSDAGHPPRFAIDQEDGDDTTAWISEPHDDPDELEWIEVSVPKGRYEDITLEPAYAGMEVYVSVHATNAMPSPSIEGNMGGFAPHTTDGENIGTGWVNHDGLGQVPGTDIPYTHHRKSVSGKATRIRIRKGGGGFVIGEDSRVRIWFRKLHRAKDLRGRQYRAGVRNLKVYERDKDKTAVTNHWILVDDVSDIVKTVLQWAGFEDWEVESVGVRLSDKIVFDRQTFLIDIIRWVCERTSYIFFVKPPDSFDADNLDKDNEANRSMGVAVFRHSSPVLARPREKRYQLNENRLLTGIRARITNEPLAGSIRIRGRAVSKKRAKRDPEHLHALGEDRTLRIQYNYRPPWARKANSRFGAIRKHTLHYEEQVKNLYEAKVGCLLIALRQALESATAVAEFPCFPPISLDREVVVKDTGTGLATRIWVAQRSWNYQGGQNASFTMNVGGSLLDTDDIKDVHSELQRLFSHHGWNPHTIARGPWLEEHFF